MWKRIKSYIRWKKELRRLNEDEYILSWHVFWCGDTSYTAKYWQNWRKYNRMNSWKSSR